MAGSSEIPLDPAIIERLDREGWTVVRKYPLLDRIKNPDVQMPWPTAPKTWLERMKEAQHGR